MPPKRAAADLDAPDPKVLFLLPLIHQHHKADIFGKLNELNLKFKNQAPKDDSDDKDDEVVEGVKDEPAAEEDEDEDEEEEEEEEEEVVQNFHFEPVRFDDDEEEDHEQEKKAEGGPWPAIAPPPHAADDEQKQADYEPNPELPEELDINIRNQLIHKWLASPPPVSAKFPAAEGGQKAFAQNSWQLGWQWCDENGKWAYHNTYNSAVFNFNYLRNVRDFEIDLFGDGSIWQVSFTHRGERRKDDHAQKHELRLT